MLIINGKKYAKNESEFVSSLFDKTGTCSGYYKKSKGKILLSDMQGNIFAAVICNYNFKGIVNARKVESGKVFYQYGASENIQMLLGLPEKYSMRSEYCENIYNSI
jgi:hypothetical protein